MGAIATGGWFWNALRTFAIKCVQRRTLIRIQHLVRETLSTDTRESIMQFTSLKSLVLLALGFSTLATAAPSTFTLELDLVDSLVDTFEHIFAPEMAQPADPQLTLIPEGVPVVQSDGTILVVDSDAKWATDDDVEEYADVAGYLNAHNQFRKEHGARDLVWDNNLAAKAQQWANSCVFKHSGGTLGPYGGRILLSALLRPALNCSNTQRTSLQAQEMTMERRRR